MPLRFPPAIQIAAAVLILWQGPTAVAQIEPVTENGRIDARVEGLLRKTAGAAEHAGFEVSAGGMTWEVDVSIEPQLAARAAQLDGRSVIVTGTYAERRGDSRTRRILSARTLDAAGAIEAPDRGFIEVTVRGVVQTGMVAIGGETTGATIRSGAVTWELELDNHHRELASRLNGRTASVTGRLTEIRGVEIRRRIVLRVTKLAKG